jgi:hypothetical protein
VKAVERSFNDGFLNGLLAQRMSAKSESATFKEHRCAIAK